MKKNVFFLLMMTFLLINGCLFGRSDSSTQSKYLIPTPREDYKIDGKIAKVDAKEAFIEVKEGESTSSFTGIKVKIKNKTAKTLGFNPFICEMANAYGIVFPPLSPTDVYRLFVGSSEDFEVAKGLEKNMLKAKNLAPGEEIEGLLFYPSLSYESILYLNIGGVYYPEDKQRINFPIFYFKQEQNK